MAYDLQKIEKFMELRAKGKSFNQIAQQLKVGKQTLIDWNKEFKEEVANRKAVEIEALQEKYFLTVQKSIEFYGSKIQRLENELKHRELLEVPTEKLFELLLKYRAALKDLSMEPIFLTEKEAKESQNEQRLLRTILEPLQDRNESGEKAGTLKSQDFALMLVKTYELYKSGSINEKTAQQEAYLLNSIIKSIEAKEFEERLERIEGVLKYDNSR
ncbi:hypothetical protein Q4S57_12405 [Priestia megaterium]|uniref:hypothetical protein n=1 Tax=Priestia megaterium TaxID=1404 RepID=UPI0026E15D88|nr:hypothetical protein [Priestia megaterium]MDO6848754.1 hypothetical protein [Priestia megaterium]